VTGCEFSGELQGNGTDTPGVDAGNDDAAIARAAFESDVVPLLDGFCAACHSGTDSIGFMSPDPDMYASVMSFPNLVDLETHGSSRLLSKGVHDGPAWTADQRLIIEDWLGLETVAAGVVPVVEPETAPFSPLVGINTVDLAQIGLTGSSITFRLEKLQVGYYISELMVNAGLEGAHLVHPLFVTWSDTMEPRPDPVDRFSGIEVNAEPQASAMIGGGTVVLVDVPENALMSIHFATAEAAVDSPGLPQGGCKVVDSFTLNARAALSASCGSCHAGGNTSATAATDLSLIDDLSPAGQLVVCGQSLSRVNLADPLNSGLFVATNPALGAAHPFKFNNDAIAFNAFRDTVLAWINAEVVAP
jgi:hypothetical protein